MILAAVVRTSALSKMMYWMASKSQDAALLASAAGAAGAVCSFSFRSIIYQVPGIYCIPDMFSLDATCLHICIFPPLVLLRGTIVNTYCLHKNLYIYLFLLTIFGPITMVPRNNRTYEAKVAISTVLGPQSRVRVKHSELVWFVPKTGLQEVYCKGQNDVCVICIRVFKNTFPPINIALFALHNIYSPGTCPAQAYHSLPDNPNRLP